MKMAPTSRPNERPAPPPPPAPASHVIYQYRPPSPMFVPKMPFMDSHHPYPSHSSGHTPPVHQQQPPHPQQQQQQKQQQQQQPTPPQQQQRQGVIQRNSSVPVSRPSDPRPSPPVSHQGRTSSPGGLLAPGSIHPSARYPMGSAPMSISSRGDSIYTHDAFASLVNAAAAQPSLPVPERDRRDREKERDPRDTRSNMPGLMPRYRFFFGFLNFFLYIRLDMFMV